MANNKNQSGQSLVEYLVIVGLIGVGSIVIMRSVGQSINVRFSQVAEALGTRVEGQQQSDTITESMYRKRDLKDFFTGSVGRDQK